MEGKAQNSIASIKSKLIRKRMVKSCCSAIPVRATDTPFRNVMGFPGKERAYEGLNNSSLKPCWEAIPVYKEDPTDTGATSEKPSKQ